MIFCFIEVFGDRPKIKEVFVGQDFCIPYQPLPTDSHAIEKQIRCMILLLHMMRPLELVGESMQEEVTLGKD